MSAIRDEDISYCIDFVKKHANDLYLADLLLPQNFRKDIFVLHAFHAEIIGIVLRTQEPTMGDIRLQWWAEVIEGGREGEAQGHPIARSLLEVIDRHELPRQALLRKLEAHQFDLYNDPMGDRTMLEGYLGETHSCLFQLSGIISGAKDLKILAEASGHAGVASGLVWIIRTMALQHKHQRVYVPYELLQATGLDSRTFLEGFPSKTHERVVIALTDLASDHRLKLKTTMGLLTKDSVVVFNQIALTDLYIERIQKRPFETMTSGVDVSQLKRQWALLKF